MSFSSISLHSTLLQNSLIGLVLVVVCVLAGMP